jgi:predicted nuclease of restriction endonuclease-like (RecB) superfamily
MDDQINSQLYERIALSRNKATLLRKAETAQPGDEITPEEAIRDPFVLEFLDLKDEYSETRLEEALISHLADFLLELGDDFAFLGRQRRLRIDDEWFRIDLIWKSQRQRQSRDRNQTQTSDRVLPIPIQIDASDHGQGCHERHI